MKDGAPEMEPYVSRPLSSFVGREREIELLSTRLGSGSRLVSIVGPPGIGKTRLAAEFAHHLSERRSCLFLDVSGTSNDFDLRASVAESLGLQAGITGPSTAIDEAIAQSLRSRDRCVVILDNFEQLVDDGTAILEHWLRRAPAASFLVTSRRLLGADGEQPLELGPLALPSSNDDWDAAAMRLFHDRARSTEPQFDLQESSPVTARLVRRLEGIPLAIELAAGQLRWATPTEILAQVSASMLDLRRPRSTKSDRHATIEATIDASWQRLSAAERSTFSQLSVFRGGFSIRAAEAVVQGLEENDLPLAEVLSSLRERSLLRVVTSPGGRRWDLYQALIEFGRARLESADAVALSKRHAAYVLEFAERGLREVTRKGVEARRLLDAEADNLRAAQRWLFEFVRSDPAPQQADIAMLWRLTLVVARVLRRRIPATAAHLVGETLRLGFGGADVHLRALLLKADAHRLSGEYDKARSDLTRASKTANADADIAEWLRISGLLEMEHGELHAARANLETAVKRARAAGDPHLEGRVHSTLAYVVNELFFDSAAFDHHSRAVELLSQAGDVVETTAARVAYARDRVQLLGEPLLDELVELADTATRLGDRHLETEVLLAMGHAHAVDRRFDEAERCYHQAFEVAEQAGMRYEIALAWINLAIVTEEKGDLKTAGRQYALAKRTLESAPSARLAGWCDLFLSGCLAARGELGGATEALARSSESLGNSEDPAYHRADAIQRARLEIAKQKARGVGALSEAPPPRGDLEEISRPPEADANEPLRFRYLRGWLCRELAAVRGENRPTLWVQSDGGAFRIGNRPVDAFPDSPLMHKVLRALAERRRSDPGQALDTDTLFQRAWPSERALPKARSMRVRSVIKRLRRSGLAGILLTRRSGFLLDPQVGLQFESPAAD